MEEYFESSFKKIGFFRLNSVEIETVNKDKHESYSKILHFPAGCTLKIDFKQYSTQKSSLFFIKANQHFQLSETCKRPCSFLYYNSDFYCMQMYHHEMFLDRFLMNDDDMSMVELSDQDENAISNAFNQIGAELAAKELSREEMIRTYLKQMIIRATRIWKHQQPVAGAAATISDQEFLRNFHRLVDKYFREKHSVADYADLLAMSPRTLSKRLSRLSLTVPNDIIKDRILLEAKRMLAYSSKSIKQISYDLGYDDPTYFHRLFHIKMGFTPATFRKQFQRDLQE